MGFTLKRRKLNFYFARISTDKLLRTTVVHRRRMLDQLLELKVQKFVVREALGRGRRGSVRQCK
jgi:hypothetical protein